MSKTLPRYPVYVPSKGRYDTCLTANFLEKDGVPFYLVVEEQEYFHYAARYGKERLVTLPERDQGVFYARNWIKAHSIENGYERHWQIDDNIQFVYRWIKGHRLHCPSGLALRAAEDFTDRYENIAISGLNYGMFGVKRATPFSLNARVYSCSLVNNSIPHRWRLRYNEDTDICLQVLADGWCTVLINAFLVRKKETMVVKGGNTDDLYQGDGRLIMARSLERMWPGVVKVKRWFQRPQHVVDWSRFDTPLKRKPDIDMDRLREDNEYGMTLVQTGELRRESYRKLMEDAKKTG